MAFSRHLSGSVILNFDFEFNFILVTNLKIALNKGDEIFTFASNTLMEYDDLKLYFMSGGSESNPTVVPNMNKMVDLLRLIGYDKIKSLVQADGTHQEWFWNREFPSAYEYLFLN